MEDTPTPWLIAQALSARGSVLWAWIAALSGTAVVLLGGIWFSI